MSTQGCCLPADSGSSSSVYLLTNYRVIVRHIRTDTNFILSFSIFLVPIPLMACIRATRTNDNADDKKELKGNRRTGIKKKKTKLVPQHLWISIQNGKMLEMEKDYREIYSV